METYRSTLDGWRVQDLQKLLDLASYPIELRKEEYVEIR